MYVFIFVYIQNSINIQVNYIKFNLFTSLISENVCMYVRACMYAYLCTFILMYVRTSFT